MALPHLVVVSGPPGSGKTTLAHRLAGEVGCPALCRDEIKEGMVHATPGFVAAPSDALTMRTYDLFFAAIRLFLDAGVTSVAEAAFQDALWRRGLEPMLGLAALRVVRCQVDDRTARERAARRLTEVSSRAAHADAAHLAHQARFVPISMDVPTLDVDTSEGYRPGLSAIADFACS
jgi:predicted kinase